MKVHLQISPWLVNAWLVWLVNGWLVSAYGEAYFIYFLFPSKNTSRPFI